MQIISNVALISINETLVVQLISFLIFLFVINRVMFRPLRESMQEREHYIEGIQLEIRDAERKLQKIMLETREEDAAVRRAGQQVAAELEKQASTEASDIIEGVRQQILEMGEKNRKEIDARVAEARKTIAEEADKLSLSIMEKVLERRLAS
ncbi:MAG: hypothetical protein LJE94_04510 [Deltaproteobacteria bacterium]|nr:hypothetical protein [Deltaproteobacteria bacterium]